MQVLSKRYPCSAFLQQFDMLRLGHPGRATLYLLILNSASERSCLKTNRLAFQMVKNKLQVFKFLFLFPYYLSPSDLLKRHPYQNPDQTERWKLELTNTATRYNCTTETHGDIQIKLLDFGGSLEFGPLSRCLRLCPSWLTMPESSCKAWRSAFVWLSWYWTEFSRAFR